MNSDDAPAFQSWEEAEKAWWEYVDRALDRALADTFPVTPDWLPPAYRRGVDTGEAETVR